MAPSVQPEPEDLSGFANSLELFADTGLDHVSRTVEVVSRHAYREEMHFRRTTGELTGSVHQSLKSPDAVAVCDWDFTTTPLVFPVTPIHRDDLVAKVDIALAQGS